MLSKKQNKERMRKKRYTTKLKERKKRKETCVFCDSPVEVLHHKDENHMNNKNNNLLNVCRKHHLQIEHSCDKDSKKIRKSFLTSNKSINYRKVFSNKPIQKDKPINNYFKKKYYKDKRNICINVEGSCSFNLTELLNKLGYSKIG